MRVLIVTGGNLFRIAAEQLGDASQWIRIARANGLSDPALPAGVAITLLLPQDDAAAGGGIARQ